ncbi:hypothetical protein Golob_011592 [Gossypium lobatum]|uniref:MADS-box domain-containing protein n=1 Tax=Gossypium lobatum TaxID=34289 RepID=A0A7J8MQ83_9ROSI|nr:hypothetical protein [Gossypium lobatum]
MIENENDRLITFSKRRLGIYKKIGELSTLCGNEIFFLSFFHPQENLLHLVTPLLNLLLTDF